MATKSKTPTSQYVCSDCGFVSPKWLGKCPGCDSFNTMQEELVRAETPKASARSALSAIPTKALPLSKIGYEKFERVKSGIEEFDTVLGGGTIL